jgi:hypothetical protein
MTIESGDPRLRAFNRAIRAVIASVLVPCFLNVAFIAISHRLPAVPPGPDVVLDVFLWIAMLGSGLYFLWREWRGMVAIIAIVYVPLMSVFLFLLAARVGAYFGHGVP